MISAEALGCLERGGPGGSRLLAMAYGVHERPTERGLEFHFGARVDPPPRHAERRLHPLPAFLDQRELEPERHGGNRESHTGRRVARGPKGPVQCGAEVADLTPPRIEPELRRLGFPILGGAGEKGTEVLCMAAGSAVEITGIDQLLLRISAHRFEQPVGHGRPAGLGCDHRLSHQARDRFDRIGFADLPARLVARLWEANDSEKQRLLAALVETKWNKTRAARKLSWSRMTVYRKMTHYRISEPAAAGPGLTKERARPSGGTTSSRSR